MTMAIPTTTGKRGESLSFSGRGERSSEETGAGGKTVGIRDDISGGIVTDAGVDDI